MTRPENLRAELREKERVPNPCKRSENGSLDEINEIKRLIFGSFQAKI
jgi:hypothetical protein